MEQTRGKTADFDPEWNLRAVKLKILKRIGTDAG